MPTLTPEEHQQVLFLLSPWLAGSLLEFVLQGVVFCQLSHYLGWYANRDYLYVKLAVAGLAILTTLKTVQSFALIWINFIEEFTDLKTALAPNWLKQGSPLMVSCIGIYCQTYFCYRLYTVSQLLSVIIIIASLLVVGFVCVVLATYEMTVPNTPQVGVYFAGHLSSVFAGDLLISMSMIFFLLKKKRESVPKRTAGILSALVWLTFQSALPAAICAMLNLIFSQLYIGTERLFSAGFNQMLPKLYAISMLWTLNARREIRIYMDLEPTSSVESSVVGRSVDFGSEGVSGRHVGVGVEAGEGQDIEIESEPSLGEGGSGTHTSHLNRRTPSVITEITESDGG